MTYESRTTVLVLIGMLLGGCGSSKEDSGPSAKLCINELQPSNQDTITDESGEADDWIEIINTGDSPVDMLGYSLSDSSGTTQTIAGTILVAPGAFHLLWADDVPSQGTSHLGFKLSGKAGDAITLKDAEGRTLDAVHFGPVTDQRTYARFPDGTGPMVWCQAPTPGEGNGSLCPAP